MTAILGVSAFYHDSAAALLIDGEIAAAAQQERFSRVKHDHRFPQEAVDWCLAEANVTPDELDYVGFYDKPLRKFERLLQTYLAFAPAGYRSFRRAMPLWIRQKLHLPREIADGLGGRRRRVVFADHHQSHAASAFYPSPFEEAAILTIDGVGEWSTACYGVGAGSKIELTREMRFPHSLGLLYSAFTYLTGFRVNSGEYKLMGLAPYGEPIYKDLILDKLLDLKADGSFRMDMRCFNYCQGLTMTSSRLHKLFGCHPRRAESPLRTIDMDLAASVQAVTEEIVLRMARHVHRETGMNRLTMAGGVALNCVANGRLLREGPFEDYWFQPAAGDAGGALGVAWFIWHQLLERERRAEDGDRQRGSFLGPQFTEDQIQQAIADHDLLSEECESDEALCDRVADLIAEKKVIGWFQGRMEFGPRALGARSILGDARSEKMQSVMNLKIKFRESFRPFAPMVLRERVHEYFEMAPGQDSPYMMLVAPVHPSLRTCRPANNEAKGLDKLHEVRSSLPAITHVDYSARIQTVDAERHPLVHRLLSRFYEKTGCPVIINTSFNVRGEPIVCTPDDACRCFATTDIDVLVIGRHLVFKDRQSRTFDHAERLEHLSQFALD